MKLTAVTAKQRKWCDGWRIKLNTGKTHLILASSKEKLLVTHQL